ncbi:hypothetical protein ACRALDRAFT_2037594, partial [Sodiomyces alcalophilus JCM 7366]|uniref:uncharacterized protein n=1 Tax=Sodiomyces alcalophilus JCM 7366 TaxID=591952 RepID=UPI0039B3FBDC
MAAWNIAGSYRAAYFQPPITKPTAASCALASVPLYPNVSSGYNRARDQPLNL